MLGIWEVSELFLHTKSGIHESFLGSAGSPSLQRIPWFGLRILHPLGLWCALGVGVAARCGAAVKIPGVLPIKAGIRTLRPISRKSPYSDEDSAKKNHRNLAKLFPFSGCRTKWPPIGGSSRSGPLGAVSESVRVASTRMLPRRVGYQCPGRDSGGPAFHSPGRSLVSATLHHHSANFLHQFCSHRRGHAGNVATRVIFNYVGGHNRLIDRLNPLQHLPGR